jgi:acetyl esterase/lipase
MRAAALAALVLAPMAVPASASASASSTPNRLRDEGDAYAKALEAAGVAVTHHCFEGVDHYFTHTGPVPAGKKAIDLMATTLRTELTS